MIYELNITLIDVGVPVWRRVHINKQESFYELHELIQATFDWADGHLFDFKLINEDGDIKDKIEISGNPWDVNNYNTDWIVYDVEDELLEDWFKKPTDYMSYTYDYGDNWEHYIEFIREVKPVDTITYPICIAAENHAPPEDSRFEIIQDKLNLIAEDTKLLVASINENIELWFPSIDADIEDHPDLQDETMINEILQMFDDEDIQEGLSEMKEEQESLEQNEWEITLQQAKAFLQAKPWKKMHEQDVFALWDPFRDRYVFCSVLGNSQEKIGVVAYYGIEGFLLLLESLSGEPLPLEDTQQHSLLLTFEDRGDLEKTDYELIKSHSTTFRGRKSWPLFTSFKPGYVPWFMVGEEISLIRIIMKETLAVIEEREHGQSLPQISQEEKILVRQIEGLEDEQFRYRSEIVHIEDLLHNEGEEKLALSELEIKRLTKLSESLPFSMEFSIVTLEVPVQVTGEDRPFFPSLVLAADTESGVIYYQDLLENELDGYCAQKTLLDVLGQINGMPKTIVTDPLTARLVLPLLDVHDIDIQIKEELGIIDFILDDMYELITDEWDNI